MGYEDGENLPFEILLQLAKRVAGVVRIPLLVDMEGGYSNSIKGIIENINKLCDAMQWGINLEYTTAADVRQFQPVAEFEKKLSAVTDHISRHNLK